MVSDDPAAKDKKVVMLTFDDGPRRETTPKILDTLKANNVKALFFVMGNIEQNADLIQRILADGHVLGTHTINHDNLSQMSKEKQRQEIAGENDRVEKITGRKPHYFRPPFGVYNDNTLALMQELDMQLINWDHGSADWMDVKNGRKDPQVVVRDVLAETPADPNKNTALHPGAIILMHDTNTHTAEALPAIIAGLRDKGYEFVTVEPK